MHMFTLFFVLKVCRNCFKFGPTKGSYPVRVHYNGSDRILISNTASLENNTQKTSAAGESSNKI